MGTKILIRRLLSFAVLVTLIVGSTAYVMHKWPARISWNPDQQVTVSVAPGEQATYSVALTHTGYFPITNTQNLQIVAKGDIAPYVTITQPSFPSVFSRGDTVSFNVNVSVPADAQPGVYNGTIALQHTISKAKVRLVWRTIPLPVEIKVAVGIVWERIEDVIPGVSIVTPPEWNITEERENLISISNVVDASPISEESLQAEADFVIRTFPGDNPDTLPISVWFDEHSSEGLAVEPWSKDVVEVGGKEALRIGVTEIVGRRYHYYIPVGRDIINIDYGLYAEHFLDEYGVMLDSIRFDN